MKKWGYRMIWPISPRFFGSRSTPTGKPRRRSQWFRAVIFLWHYRCEVRTIVSIKQCAGRQRVHIKKHVSLNLDVRGLEQSATIAVNDRCRELKAQGRKSGTASGGPPGRAGPAAGLALLTIESSCHFSSGQSHGCAINQREALYRYTTRRPAGDGQQFWPRTQFVCSHSDARILSSWEVHAAASHHDLTFL